MRLKILDGKVTLYTRSNSSSFWAEFFDGKQQHRTTTKTSDQEQAKQIATKWWIQLQSGDAPVKPARVPVARTFETASRKALEDYRGDGHAFSYVHSLEKLFHKLCTFIGNTDITTINQQTLTILKDDARKANPDISAKTLHQYKNGLMVVLKAAYLRGDIPEQVAFVREFTPKAQKKSTHRVYFNIEEYRLLKDALRENIKIAKQQNNGHLQDAEELFDYVIFMVNTGLRIGESNQVRFCDITFAMDNGKEVLHISNISGKVGNDGVCKSYTGAPSAFRRIIARFGLTEKNYRQSQEVIWKAYHREMFKAVLRRNGLYQTSDRPPRKRDLMCCRHTYICFALARKVPVADVASNTRTSIAMIESAYARHRDILSNMNINMNFADMGD